MANKNNKPADNTAKSKGEAAIKAENILATVPQSASLETSLTLIGHEVISELSEDTFDGLEQGWVFNQCEKLPAPIAYVFHLSLVKQGAIANVMMRRVIGIDADVSHSAPLTDDECETIINGNHTEIFLEFGALSIRRAAYMPYAHELLSDYAKTIILIGMQSSLMHALDIMVDETNLDNAQDEIATDETTTDETTTDETTADESVKGKSAAGDA